MTERVTTVDPSERVALVDLVNRVLDRGVVVTGSLTIAVADVDLLYVGLRLVLTSAERLERAHARDDLVLLPPAAP